MRRSRLAACLFVAAATLGAANAEAAQPLTQMSSAERSLLTAINSARAASGVALNSAALWQSQVLARAGILDHTSPDGSTLLDRLTRVRWHGSAAGEDLAVASSPAGAVAMWMQSPGHRENLLRASFRSVGVGLARGVWNGRSAFYVTADFAS
jgi:uncharacterized protein YkwD